ncbi:MAG: hypothetical protein WA476_20410 [Acidobacteriaceae bacterium]
MARQTGAGGMMAVAEEALAASILQQVDDGLRAVLSDAEKEIGTVARDFEELARTTDVILKTAGTIVGCVESDRMATVLPRVRRLGAAAKRFIHARLEATSGILETVTAEAALLERLAQLTQGQRAIVRETEMLRVLTNIEVARLGEVGAGFQYLAHELDDFSRAVARSTNELTTHTDERRKAIAEMRLRLARELPQMREEFARMEESLENSLGLAESTLSQLRATPERFQGSVEGIAGQIAGVVAAIQAHDITRQQIEHVQEALAGIAAEMDAGENTGELDAGLAIQSCQLKNAGETVRGWTAQIRTCLEEIRHIASAEILELGPVVLGQESAVSTQLTRIERLEQACEAGNAKVQASFAGIFGLMRLVSEHLERSRSVRDRLQLLMFNSIVEASHLGTQADGILEISTSIKRISAAWGEITARSEAATQEIRALVENSRTTLAAFSEESNHDLREAREETVEGLEILRSAAECTDSSGREIQTATLALQAKIAEIAETDGRLETCFGRLASTAEAIEAAPKRGSSRRDPDPYDREAVERRFSANYTTEMERAVLRAALGGGPMPVAQQCFGGNSVELF